MAACGLLDFWPHKRKQSLSLRPPILLYIYYFKSFYCFRFNGLFLGKEQHPVRLSVFWVTFIDHGAECGSILDLAATHCLPLRHSLQKNQGHKIDLQSTFFFAKWALLHKVESRRPKYEFSTRQTAGSALRLLHKKWRLKWPGSAFLGHKDMAFWYSWVQHFCYTRFPFGIWARVKIRTTYIKLSLANYVGLRP